MSEKYSPCVEKQCSKCCDPVKVRMGFPDNKIPLDENNEKIWERQNEIYIPEDHMETTRLETFNCLKYDPRTKKCLIYEKRPEICKNTSCIGDDSKESIDEQHQKAIKTKYIISKREDGL